MAKSDDRRVHPYIPKLVEQFEARRVDRREFLRTATLLGMSAPVAYGIVGKVLGESAIPRARAQATPKQGGIFRVGMEVQKMDDPATYSWTQMSNQTRHIAEYLAITGPDNVTRPMLAESWEASDDLKTWTFHLRQGVLWHNGEEFVADHVVWNIERWVNPDLASSNSGLSTFASLDSVEAVDQHTVRLNLNKAVLSAPEDCYNYPTAILHPSFEPPFSDNPIGTGPFTLGEPLAVGDRCILKRITQTTDGKEFKYWGGDVYLDEIHYYHFDADNQLTAFASGEVDSIYGFGVEQYEFAEALDGEIVAGADRADRVLPLPGLGGAVRQQEAAPGDRQGDRQHGLPRLRVPGPRRHRREPPRRAGASRVLPAAALAARRRGGQGAARGGRLSRRHRPHHRRRQHRPAPGSRRCASCGATSSRMPGSGSTST